MRRSLVLILAVLLVLSLALPGAASAAGNRKYISTHRIANCVQTTQMKTLEKMVDNANRQIDMLVKWAKFTPYNDVNWLIASVEAVVRPVFAYADHIGATVECVYVEHIIDGQAVLIDPLRIVRL